jgi:hypothetical protein
MNTSVIFGVVLKILGYIFGKLKDKEEAKRALADLIVQLELEIPKQAELRKKYADKRAEMLDRREKETEGGVNTPPGS